jgi:hypothetical protein
MHNKDMESIDDAIALVGKSIVIKEIGEVKQEPVLVTAFILKPVEYGDRYENSAYLQMRYLNGNIKEINIEGIDVIKK